MGIQQSAVARGTGISTQYVPKTGGAAPFLPQRIAVIAQPDEGTSAVAKFQVTGGPAQVGAAGGYKNPGYIAVSHLYPVNGGGVGGIPVDMIFVDKGSGASAATGDITPTASAVSRAVSFVPVVGGVRCNPFTVPKTASVTAADLSDFLESARQSINGKLGVPGTVAHAYGSPTGTAAGGNTGNGTISVSVASGGTPKAGTFTATCTATASDAGTFTLVDPNGFTLGTVTVGGGATTIGGLSVTIADGAEDFVVGDAFTIEVPSTKLNFTSGWRGASANAITLQMDGPTDAGITWAFTQPNGGATDPSVSAALSQIGDVWNTLVINTLSVSNTTALDTFQAWGGNPDDGTGRWAPTVKKPAFVMCGNNAVTVDAATTVSNARPTDNVNVVVNVPGSPNLPCAIAAAAAREVAKRANDNPPHDYGSLKLTDITPGTDAQAWNGDARELAVQRGCSTVQIKDGVVQLSDIITMYKPVGEQPPAYRFVCDIVKLQNITYNFDLVFAGEDWDGKPLIPDGQPTVNPEARKPSTAVGDMNAILDGLALQAIISDPKAAKAASSVSINAQNPKRLDIVPVFDLAGNTNIKDISMKFSFFFG